MDTITLPRPCPAQPPAAHTLLRPRLARRDQLASGGRAWITPGFGSSTAFISLSPGLVCVFDSPSGEGLTHQQIGGLGLTPHQAWDASAASLRKSARGEDAAEFYARPASVALGDGAPRGVEVRGGVHTAAAWLAHPRTFTLVDTHFREVLDARELVYLSRDQRELFVFSAPEAEVAAAVGAAGVMRNSLGFPLLIAHGPAML